VKKTLVNKTVSH